MLTKLIDNHIQIPAVLRTAGLIDSGPKNARAGAFLLTLRGRGALFYGHLE